MLYIFYFFYIHGNEELIIRYISRKKEIIGNNFLINYSTTLVKTIRIFEK